MSHSPAEQVRALIIGGVAELRRRMQSGLRTTLVGDDAPVVKLDDRPDQGLFGPDSATWDVHSDAAMLIGGVRALLMQTLHPRAMAGVAEHSQYRTDPTGRLWRTARYVGTTTFGTTAEATAAIRGVQRVHDRVAGTTPDGQAYSANDPHLLAFVQATLVESFAVTRDRFGTGRLSPAQLDRYVAEQARIADLFGADAFPTSWAGLNGWMADIRPELRATPAAREAVRFLLAPPLAVQLRGPYALLAAAAVSTLPWWARRELRLPVLPLTERLAVRPAAITLTRVLGWALEAPTDDGRRAPGPSPRSAQPSASDATSTAAPMPSSAIHTPRPVPAAKRSQASSRASRNSSSGTVSRTRTTARKDPKNPATISAHAKTANAKRTSAPAAR